ncbi:ATP-binding protein [Flavobacterium sp. CGRL2]
MRGENAKGITGFGLGLRIVNRILTLHNSHITYSIPANNINLFCIIFRK